MRWSLGVIALLAACAEPRAAASREASPVPAAVARAAPLRGVDAGLLVAADAGPAPPSLASTGDDVASVIGDAEREEPLDPAENRLGLAALCSGHAVHVGEAVPFRGVAPRDNGGGWCCPVEGKAFVCVMTDGGQHEHLIYEHARFFTDTGRAPSLELLAEVNENLGMSVGSQAIVQLVARVGPGGMFTLSAEPATHCKSPRAEMRPLCRAQGRYRMNGGAPQKLPR